MAQEIIRQFRHELKYLISESEAEVIKNRIKVIMHTDKHAGPDGYSIRSLYFDDIKDTALVEKDSGVSSRHKYRIRIYNYSDNVIMLERKRKEEQYIQKTSVSMTRAEYDKINKGDYDFLLGREEILCHDFYVERHPHDWIYNIAPNLVEHVDWLIGGSKANVWRGYICRSSYWEDEYLVNNLIQKLASR